MCWVYLTSEHISRYGEFGLASIPWLPSNILEGLLLAIASLDHEVVYTGALGFTYAASKPAIVPIVGLHSQPILAQSPTAKYAVPVILSTSASRFTRCAKTVSFHLGKKVKGHF